MTLLDTVKKAQQKADATGSRFDVWENTRTGAVFCRPASLEPPEPAATHRLVTVCEPGR